MDTGVAFEVKKGQVLSLQNNIIANKGIYTHGGRKSKLAIFKRKNRYPCFISMLISIMKHVTYYKAIMRYLSLPTILREIKKNKNFCWLPSDE